MMDGEFIKNKAIYYLVLTAAILFGKGIVANILSKYITFLGNSILQFVAAVLILIVGDFLLKKMLNLSR